VMKPPVGFVELNTYFFNLVLFSIPLKKKNRPDKEVGRRCLCSGHCNPVSCHSNNTCLRSVSISGHFRSLKQLEGPLCQAATCAFTLHPTFPSRALARSRNHNIWLQRPRMRRECKGISKKKRPERTRAKRLEHGFRQVFRTLRDKAFPKR